MNERLSNALWMVWSGVWSGVTLAWALEGTISPWLAGACIGANLAVLVARAILLAGAVR